MFRLSPLSAHTTGISKFVTVTGNSYSQFGLFWQNFQCGGI
jgi:hypothetical protein